MQTVKEAIGKLFRGYSKAAITSIEKLPQSGSDRVYYRIYTDAGNYIATCNQNVKENNTFISFSRHFKACGCPVPMIYAVNEEQTIYIQEDFGDVSLLHELEEKGYTDYVCTLFQKSLKALAHLQVTGDKNLDYEQCITSMEFGKQAIISDLLYFKYYC